MAEQDDSIFGGLFSEPAENIQPETVGAIDYLTDIPVGAIKGVSQAVQGLLQLGAMILGHSRVSFYEQIQKRPQWITTFF